MEKVQVLVRSHSDFAGGVDELTFRGTGTLEKTDYGYRLRYTAQNELDGSAVASEVRLETQQPRGPGHHPPHGVGPLSSPSPRTAATACCWTLNGKRSRRSPAATAVR